MARGPKRHTRIHVFIGVADRYSDGKLKSNIYWQDVCFNVDNERVRLVLLIKSESNDSVTMPIELSSQIHTLADGGGPIPVFVL